jgi:hypothetical protein
LVFLLDLIYVYINCDLFVIFPFFHLCADMNIRGHDGDSAVSAHHNYAYVGRRGKLWAGLHGAPRSTQELSKLRSALLKRNRGTREPCVIPDKLLYRVDVGNEGALCVSFSHSGHVLASKNLLCSLLFASSCCLTAL